MENEQAQERNSERGVFDLVKRGPKEKDLLAPWFKISSNMTFNNPTKTLFTRYISFYTTLILSGNEDGFIHTETILSISKDFEISKTVTENCIQDLTSLNLLLKVKRGLYQINPIFLNKKQNVKDSNALVKKAQNVQNNQTVINNPVYNIINEPQSDLLKSLLEKSKQLEGLNNL